MRGLKILNFLFVEIALPSVQIEPLYWNASNPIFTSGKFAQLEVHIGEKLDVYCPKRNPLLHPTEPLYLKVFMVTEHDFLTCRVTDYSFAKKIFTCNTPDKEKKHTLLFQEINPNPYGLKFKRGQQYFLMSTSDGGDDSTGMDFNNSDVCDKHNMKIKIGISDFQDPETASDNKWDTSAEISIRPLMPWTTQKDIEADLAELESEELELDLAQSSGFTIGIIIGAFTVLVLIFGGVCGYRWQSRRGDIRKALYIPRPRPASSQVHLTLVPAGTSYPYDTRKARPISGVISQNGLLSGPAFNGAAAEAHYPCSKDQVVTKGSPPGTFSSRQDSLGETSCGSEMTYLDPGSGGVVEV